MSSSNLEVHSNTYSTTDGVDTSTVGKRDQEPPLRDDYYPSNNNTLLNGNNHTATSDQDDKGDNDNSNKNDSDKVQPKSSKAALPQQRPLPVQLPLPNTQFPLPIVVDSTQYPPAPPSPNFYSGNEFRGSTCTVNKERLSVSNDSNNDMKGSSDTNTSSVPPPQPQFPLPPPQLPATQTQLHSPHQFNHKVNQRPVPGKNGSFYGNNGRNNQPHSGYVGGRGGGVNGVVGGRGVGYHPQPPSAYDPSYFHGQPPQPHVVSGRGVYGGGADYEFVQTSSSPSAYVNPQRPQQPPPPYYTQQSYSSMPQSSHQGQQMQYAPTPGGSSHIKRGEPIVTDTAAVIGRSSSSERPLQRQSSSTPPIPDENMVTYSPVLSRGMTPPAINTSVHNPAPGGRQPPPPPYHQHQPTYVSPQHQKHHHMHPVHSSAGIQQSHYQAQQYYNNVLSQPYSTSSPHHVSPHHGMSQAPVPPHIQTHRTAPMQQQVPSPPPPHLRNSYTQSQQGAVVHMTPLTAHHTPPPPPGYAQYIVPSVIPEAGYEHGKPAHSMPPGYRPPSHSPGTGAPPGMPQSMVAIQKQMIEIRDQKGNVIGLQAASDGAAPPPNYPRPSSNIVVTDTASEVTSSPTLPKPTPSRTLDIRDKDGNVIDLGPRKSTSRASAPVQTVSATQGAPPTAPTRNTIAPTNRGPSGIIVHDTALVEDNNEVVKKEQVVGGGIIVDDTAKEEKKEEEEGIPPKTEVPAATSGSDDVEDWETEDINTKIAMVSITDETKTKPSSSSSDNIESLLSSAPGIVSIPTMSSGTKKNKVLRSKLAEADSRTYSGSDMLDAYTTATPGSTSASPSTGSTTAPTGAIPRIPVSWKGSGGGSTRSTPHITPSSSSDNLVAPSTASDVVSSMPLADKTDTAFRSSLSSTPEIIVTDEAVEGSSPEVGAISSNTATLVPIAAAPNKRKLAPSGSGLHLMGKQSPGQVPMFTSGAPKAPRMVYSKEELFRVFEVLLNSEQITGADMEERTKMRYSNIITSSGGSGGGNSHSGYGITRSGSMDGYGGNNKGGGGYSGIALANSQGGYGNGGASWKRADSASLAAAAAANSALPLSSSKRNARGRNQNVAPMPKRVVTDPMEQLTRDVKALLNKITPQTFSKLSQQICDFDLKSSAALDCLIHEIFEKAVDEPKFSHMYAELCLIIEESQRSRMLPFIKIVFDKDENRFMWVKNLSFVDVLACGPYRDEQECIQVAMAAKPPAMSPLEVEGNPNMELYKLLISNKVFLKIFRDTVTERFFLSFLPVVDVADQISDKVFLEAENAKMDALKMNTLKRKILMLCQKEYTNTTTKQGVYAKFMIEEEKLRNDIDTGVLDPGTDAEPTIEMETRLSDLEYLRIKLKNRMMGNIRFVGELFKMKLVPARVMHDCISEILLDRSEESGEYVEWKDSYEDSEIELLCHLLRTVGRLLEESGNKNRDTAQMDSYFQRLMLLSQDRSVGSRIRFGIVELIELRMNNWTERREQEKPQKLEEIHAAAAAEARNAGGNNNNNNNRFNQSSSYGNNKQQSFQGSGDNRKNYNNNNNNNGPYGGSPANNKRQGGGGSGKYQQQQQQKVTGIMKNDHGNGNNNSGSGKSSSFEDVLGKYNKINRPGTNPLTTPSPKNSKNNSHPSREASPKVPQSPPVSAKNSSNAPTTPIACEDDSAPILYCNFDRDMKERLDSKIRGIFKDFVKLKNFEDAMERTEDLAADYPPHIFGIQVVSSFMEYSLDCRANVQELLMSFLRDPNNLMNRFIVESRDHMGEALQDFDCIMMMHESLSDYKNAPEWLGSILSYITHEIPGCDYDMALAAVNKGLQLCMEDEYFPDKAIGKEAFDRLLKAIKK